MSRNKWIIMTLRTDTIPAIINYLYTESDRVKMCKLGGGTLRQHQTFGLTEQFYFVMYIINEGKIFRTFVYKSLAVRH
jgi:hypothetical protein